MRFKNTVFKTQCAITMENINRKDGLLVKVPAEKATEKNVYYYLADEEAFNSLKKCPLTRRDISPYTIKLSALSNNQFNALKESSDELITDVSKLDSITGSYPWQGRLWKPMRDFIQQLTPIQHSIGIYAVALTLAVCPYAGIAVMRYYYEGNTSIINDFVLLNAFALSCAGIEYVSRRLSDNRFGLFSSVHRGVLSVIEPTHPLAIARR